MNAGLVDLFGECDSSSGGEDEFDEFASSLPPEVERGNIEYKLKLIDPSPTRFEHLVTQMKWRLQEGLGEAIYEIGVNDNGFLCGLTHDEMSKSLDTLRMMADRLGASLHPIRERTIAGATADSSKKSAEILIRKVPDDSQFIDIRIAVLGNVEAGKSTLVSVLTHDELDNGFGRARLNLLRHIHEIQTGHTSSISDEIMGFNNTAEVQNFANCRSTDEILEKSSKIITFIDLAGHSKYMKTTVFGLTGYLPDFTMLIINANSGIAGTTKEHLGFSMALEVRVFIVINKTDTCTPQALEKTLAAIEFLLKSPGCGKIPMMIRTDDDAVLAAQHFVEPRICPIFAVSCVDGTNLDKLRKFLHVLPPFMNVTKRECDMQQLTEFRIDELFFKKKPGHILAGMLIKGSIQEHEKLLLGPFEFGEFVPVVVQTVQRYRVPCRIVRAGQSAALSIGNPSDVREKLRKGMVLVSEKLNPAACMQFEADVYLLFHANQITKCFQATVHIGNVCQTASIVSIVDKECLRTNERAKVVWRFRSRPEYLTVGSRLIFREGTTKGMGEVTKVYPFMVPSVAKGVEGVSDLLGELEQRQHAKSNVENKPPFGGKSVSKRKAAAAAVTKAAMVAANRTRCASSSSAAAAAAIAAANHSKMRRRQYHCSLSAAAADRPAPLVTEKTPTINDHLDTPPSSQSSAACDDTNAMQACCSK